MKNIIAFILMIPFILLLFAMLITVVLAPIYLLYTGNYAFAIVLGIILLAFIGFEISEF